MSFTSGSIIKSLLLSKKICNIFKKINKVVFARKKNIIESPSSKELTKVTKCPFSNGNAGFFKQASGFGNKSPFSHKSVNFWYTNSH